MPESPAVRFTKKDSALVARAREFLRSGPAESAPLISYVCQLPNAPPAVADRLARALLAEAADVATDEGGRWMLLPEKIEGGGDTPAFDTSPLRALSYVVVDVETTGTRAFGGDRITEIAAVTVRDGAITDVFETLVNPQRAIPPVTTALTHISWPMVKNAPLFREVAPRLTSVLRERLFVAHNVGFDWRFVSAELERASGLCFLGERLCTVRLARAFLPQVRRRSLDALARYFGVEITARHRAAGDALATAKILLRLLDEAEARGCSTRQDLRAATLPAPTRHRRRRRGRPHWGDGDFAA